MRSHHLVASLVLGTVLAVTSRASAIADASLDAIQTIVVLYAENRSFDHLFGGFPGAEGLQDVSADAARQTDRDGTPLTELPPIWGGLTVQGASPVVREDDTEHLPNAPFAIDERFKLSLMVETRDLVHRFYQNQM